MGLEIRYWKVLERHPLSAEYEDIKGRTWTLFVEGIRAFGILDNRKVVMHDGMVIDGWQLQRACVECDIKPEYKELKLPKGMSVEEWVEAVNDRRRHETQERAMQRADERRERVAAARAEGKSETTIAEEEGVSQTTIHKDIEKLDEEKDVENDSAYYPQLPEPENGKVTGKDGKKYSAKKPKKLCPACQHRKDVGKPLIEKCEDCKALNKKKPKGEKAAAPEEPPEEPKDDNGEFWKDKAPKAIKRVAVAPMMKEMSRLLAGMIKKIEDTKDLQYYTYSMQSVIAGMTTLKQTLLGSIPAYICPYCDGTTKTLEGAQKGKTCEVCDREGWVTKSVYKRSPKGQEK